MACYVVGYGHTRVEFKKAFTYLQIFVQTYINMRSMHGENMELLLDFKKKRKKMR